MGAEIDVRDCPECENGTKGTIDGRVKLDGRCVYRCPTCQTAWQDADEEPSSKGFVLPSPSTGEDNEEGVMDGE